MLLKKPLEALYSMSSSSLLHWPLTSTLDHFNNPAILPLSDSTVVGQTLVSLVIWEEYIEELLWFSWASLCIVYWVCLIALCPNQRVQAGRAGVYRDALCCGLSQRAKNIHSTHGSEGEPIHSSVNTHKHTHSWSHTFVHQGPMAVHKCWAVYLSVCMW